MSLYICYLSRVLLSCKMLPFSSLHVCLLVLVLASLVDRSYCLLHRRSAQDVYHAQPAHQHSALHSSPVFLHKYSTPEAAQQATRVHLQSPPGIESYAGYAAVSVNTSCDSNLFWWFFPPQDDDPSAPVLLWLNGGPGASSMYGLFAELGPFSVAADGQTLQPRNSSWTQHLAVLFVDSPVGTGFSYTNSSSCYSEDMADVSTNLYSLLTQFFTAFPQWQPNPFYACGESYAGKYVPSIALLIHKENLLGAPVPINLYGISVGDGLVDPITQLPGYGQLLYDEGMADADELLHWTQQEAQMVRLIRANKADEAFAIFDALLNGDFFPYPTFFQNTTGLSDYFNLLQPDYPPNPFESFLTLESTRQQLHVGDHPFWSYNRSVELHLLHDWFRSVSAALPTLLSKYRVLIYNGQLDIILSAPACQRFLQQLIWADAKEWRMAAKQVWRLPGDGAGAAPAGYVKEGGGLTYVVVRGAGHLLPQDQPERAHDMITRFVNGQSWT